MFYNAVKSRTATWKNKLSLIQIILAMTLGLAWTGSTFGATQVTYPLTNTTDVLYGRTPPGTYSINVIDDGFMSSKITYLSASSSNAEISNLIVDGSCIKFNVSTLPADQTPVTINISGLTSLENEYLVDIQLTEDTNLPASDQHKPPLTTNCPPLPGASNSVPKVSDVQVTANPDDPSYEGNIFISLNEAVNDPDFDYLTLSIATPPEHGIAEIQETAFAYGQSLSILYTPNPDFRGVDHFVYKIDDGQGGIAQATVTAEISEPIAVAGPTATPTQLEKIKGVNIQVGRLSSNMELAVKVADTEGVPLPNISVDWTVTKTSGNADAGVNYDMDALLYSDIITEKTPSLTTATNENGQALVKLWTGKTPATYEVKAAIAVAGSDTPLSTTFTVNVGLVALVKPDTPQGAMASTLDSMCPQLQAIQHTLNPTEQALLDRCNEIISASNNGEDAEVAKALRELAPEEVATQGRIGNSIAIQQLGNIGSRLAALRDGATGVALTGLAFNINGETVPGIVLSQFLPDPLRGGGASADESGNIGSKLGLFVSGTLGGGDKQATAQEDGFGFNTKGLTVGLDYRFTAQSAFGAAIGYANTNAKVDDSGGDLRAGGLSMSIYGTYYHTQSFYVDGVFNYGANDYDMTRNIDYTLTSTHVQRAAKSKTNSGLSSISLGGGYEVALKNGIATEISARVNYVNSSIDGYEETGANELNLAIESQTLASLSVDLGGRVSRAFSMRWGVLIPQFDFVWEHEYQGNAYPIKGQFVNDQFNTTFAFKTDNPDRDYFRVGMGLSAVVPGGTTAFIQYQSTLGRKNFKDYTIALGGRIELPY